jgi:AcrR family transcriptional regulator
MTADERRQQVLAAAMHEFGLGGYDSVSVSAIAERAGVSQPYVFRLFGTKKQLFLACIEERTRVIREAFRSAAEASPEEPLEAMASAYLSLLLDDPVALRAQLQAWSSAPDPEIGDAARSSYLSVWRDVHALTGIGAEEVRDFMAHGMLLTVLAVLDLPDLYADPSLPLRGQSPQE